MDKKVVDIIFPNFPYLAI